MFNTLTQLSSMNFSLTIAFRHIAFIYMIVSVCSRAVISSGSIDSHYCHFIISTVVFRNWNLTDSVFYCLCVLTGGLIRILNGQFSSTSSSPFAGTPLTIKTLIDTYDGKLTCMPEASHFKSNVSSSQLVYASLRKCSCRM